ncbi:MAG TPA: serine/threonine-protein kinase, partial [Candidatus Polarisedimenticolaceae bacterium]|nr:serine/threonine-protein kinase [Candidatus Polarisedimenticolaceae bacterium]
MTDEPQDRFQLVERIFQRALALPDGDARERYLEQACGGDPELHARVRSLLDADSRNSGLTDVVHRAAAGLVGTASAGAHDASGRRIGPYRVTGKLGHGGMGVVYRAVRDDDEYNKQVAIKLVSPIGASEDWIRRFRQERNILARLDHPNIARLLDGGTTDDELPYVVMEYVEGRPIDRWCDEQRLDLDERIELFRQVCDAVHEAHRNLVVHRDLKPANVLVGTDGRPRLLDFGIAKLLDPKVDDAALAAPTRTAGRLLTPEYASPEQVRGLPVSTASDVYSLGVMLYELLAGVRPYRLDGAPPAEIDRLVCEV